MEPLISLFQKDLGAVVNKYRDQGLTVGEAVGAFEIVKLDLYFECNSSSDNLLEEEEVEDD